MDADWCRKYVNSCGLVGVLIGMVGGCTPPGPNGGASNNNDNDNQNGRPQWQLVLKDLPSALLSISGTSPTDVYAIGADPADGRGPYVLRYNGDEWRRLDTGASGDLWWISETPIDGSFYLAGEGGLILRYDTTAGTFEQQVTPGDELLFGVWGADADTMWAVGGDIDNPDTGGVIWRFDNSQWVEEDLSAIAPNGIPQLFKVWGRSADEVYAVGFAGIVLRFDGTAWLQLESGTTRRLFTVHGNANETVAVGGFASGVIVELAGEAFVNRAVPLTPQMNGVFIPPDGNGVAVGIEAAVAFQTASGWEVQMTGLPAQTTRDFHATWVDPAGGIWAVGGNVVSDPLNEGILAHFGSSNISASIANP